MTDQSKSAQKKATADVTSKDTLLATVLKNSNKNLVASALAGVTDANELVRVVNSSDDKTLRETALAYTTDEKGKHALYFKHKQFRRSA